MTDERKIPCFLIERTDEMTPFVDGISSPIYRRVDTGERMHVGWGERHVVPQAPFGAMWIAGPVGLVVRTPGGDWHVDQLSRSGNGWTRHGTPPLLTVEGSILFAYDDGVYKEHGIPLGHRKYHGHLINGFLEEC